jgi:hypothetical protein
LLEASNYNPRAASRKGCHFAANAVLADDDAAGRANTPFPARGPSTMICEGFGVETAIDGTTLVKKTGHSE